MRLDVGGIQAYEERYGGHAEKPITDWDFPHSDITEAEFDRVWADSRVALENGLWRPDLG